MTESELKRQLTPVLENAMPFSMVFRHEDMFRSGVPDISITWGQRLRTVWLEVKLADPELVHRGAQDVTCMKLAHAGKNCWHVVYYQKGDIFQTLIVLPLFVHRGTWRTDTVTSCEGWNHQFVANFARQQFLAEL